jgi:hypothetical protein
LKTQTRRASEAAGGSYSYIQFKTAVALLVSEARLLFGNLRDGAHGALLKAIAARDASLFIRNFDDTAGYFQNLLRAGIDADSAADAFVGIDNRMRHDNSFSFELYRPRSRGMLSIQCARYHDIIRLQEEFHEKTAVGVFSE